jgi:starch-binding outer membrane protein, SusD/RagB family
MKQLIKISGIFTLSLFLLISCNKDYLNPDPLSFYAPENVFVNKAGFQSALVTVRRDLKNEFYAERNPIVLDIDASDIAIDKYAPDWNSVTPSSGTYLPILPMFGRIYGYIKNTNVVISRIDNIKWDKPEDRNPILAEALFFRSYWYYRLVYSYGDVPFIGKEIAGAKLDFYSHSKWAILKKIQSDLEYASQWLPNSAKLGYPTKYAALHLLAKVYIANGEFDKAIEASSNVINGPFALMSSRFGTELSDTKRNLIWDLHRCRNKSLSTNTEAILICVDRAEAPTAAKTVGTYTMRNYTPEWRLNFVKDSQGKLGTIDIIGGKNTPMYDTLGRGNSNVITSPYVNYTIWAYGGYYWKNTPDLRRADINWVDVKELLYNNPASVDFGKPFNAQYFASLDDSISTMYPFPWYKIWVPHEAGFTGNPMGGNGDWYVFRLAETYLIRAEAYWWKNQLDLALADINKVRQRAKAVPISSSAEVNIDLIFDERARELYAEEMRHSEMLRIALTMAKLNKGGYSLNNFNEKNWAYDRIIKYNSLYAQPMLYSRKTGIKPYHVFWPINVNDIMANTMGVINQNIGYQGSENNVAPLEVIED